MLIEPLVSTSVRSDASSRHASDAASPRLLVIPGLHGSGMAHWQTWLQRRHAAVTDRVEQDDWSTPDLVAWAARIGAVVDASGAERRIAVAHSFGCLAVIRYLQTRGAGIDAAVLVAPAEPARFGLEDIFRRARLAIPTVLVASANDPWMSLESARRWAAIWQTPIVSLGHAGHINAEAGYGPLPIVESLIESLIDDMAAAA